MHTYSVDKTLKILILDPHLQGGGQVRYVTNLARELVRMRHHVTIGCRPGSVLADRAAETGCACHERFRLRGGLRPLAWLHDIHILKRFIRTEQPDIIHVNGSQDHWTAATTNALMGRPACIVRTRHNTYPVRDNAPNRLLNRDWTDYQIVVCECVRKALAAEPAFDETRMCAIHNGVDAQQFRPDPAARKQARAEFGYREEDLVCGIAARLVEAKGHAYLLRAAALLTNDLPNLRILIIGQGDRELVLRKIAKECQIADIVQFAGFRDNMAHCVQAFDIGVQPSIDCDTSSFSLKEQMAAEKPIIASDYGGLPEIVTDGVEGFVVPARESTPLAEAIRRLAREPELRARMGAAGRQRALKDFTIEVFAERTAAAYGRAIEIHHERAAHR